MTYEELVKAILAMLEEHRKRKAIISNCSFPFELRAEIDSFTGEEDLEDKDFPFLTTSLVRTI